MWARNSSWSFFLLIGAWCQAAPASEPGPTDSEVRAAVERSLPFVVRGGTVWMKERQCVSCHQVPFEEFREASDPDCQLLGSAWATLGLLESLPD